LGTFNDSGPSQQDLNQVSVTRARITSEDFLNTGFKGTLGKVYRFFASGAGMLFVKLV